MKKKNRITSTDSRIFGSIYRANRPLPIKRVATRVGVSWPTARNSVNKLSSMGVLVKDQSIRRTNVAVNNNFLRSLHKTNLLTRRTIPLAKRKVKRGK
jgi:predicted transcriptional regulator